MPEALILVVPLLIGCAVVVQAVAGAVFVALFLRGMRAPRTRERTVRR